MRRRRLICQIRQKTSDWTTLRDQSTQRWTTAGRQIGMDGTGGGIAPAATVTFADDVAARKHRAVADGDAVANGGTNGAAVTTDDAMANAGAVVTNGAFANGGAAPHEDRRAANNSRLAEDVVAGNVDAQAVGTSMPTVPQIHRADGDDQQSLSRNASQLLRTQSNASSADAETTLGRARRANRATRRVRASVLDDELQLSRRAPTADNASAPTSEERA